MWRVFAEIWVQAKLQVSIDLTCFRECALEEGNSFRNSSNLSAVLYIHPFFVDVILKTTSSSLATEVKRDIEEFTTVISFGNAVSVNIPHSEVLFRSQLVLQASTWPG